MSKVAFVVRGFGSSKAKVVSVIRQHTGLPLSEILHCVAGGIPILEKRLFHRDHADVARALLSLIDELPALGAEFSMFQLPECEVFSIDNTQRYGALRVEKLRNILAAHDEELQRQGELAFREAEIDDT